MQRTLLIFASVIAVAVLGAQLRGEIYEQRAGEAVDLAFEGKASPAVVAQGRRDIDKARRWRSDGPGLRNEVNLLLFTGRFAPATSVATRLVRNEPEDYAGWALLSLATPDRDGAQATRAKARAAQLYPSGEAVLELLAASPALQQAYRRASSSPAGP